MRPGITVGGEGWSVLICRHLGWHSGRHAPCDRAVWVRERRGLRLVLDRPGGRRMIQLETSPVDRVRVFGALTGAALETLLEMVKTTDVQLDLSGVREVDAEAVQLLARLAPDRCEGIASPRWLAARIEMERRSQPGVVAA
jgi:hypothetical protein